MSEWYTKRTFGSLPETMAERFGGREALVFGDERYTFQDVLERVPPAGKPVERQAVIGLTHGLLRDDHPVAPARLALTIGSPFSSIHRSSRYFS